MLSTDADEASHLRHELAKALKRAEAAEKAAEVLRLHVHRLESLLRNPTQAELERVS